MSLYLSAEGIDATTKRTPAGLSDSLGDDALDPDLSIGGVDVNISSKLTHRLSEDLDAVTRGAEIRGVGVGAFVQWRGDRPIASAYVVTTLGDFAKLVRGDHLSPP